jgi:MSHA biogenesis protein MshN
MSVINRMLKDLDQRAARSPLALESMPATPAAARQPAAEAARVAAPSAPRAPRAAPRWRLPAIVLAGGAAIAAVALADLSPGAALPTPPLAEATSSAPAADTPAAAAAPADAVPVPAPLPAPLPVAMPVAVASPAPMPLPVTLPVPAARDAVEPPRATTSARAALATTTPDALLASVAHAPRPLPEPTQIDKRSLPQSASQQAAAVFRDAVELARAGQRQAASQRALEAVALEPQHAAARQLAAVLQYESGATEGAVALLRAGAGLAGAPPALTLLLARLLSTQGQPDEALAVLDRHGLHSGDAEGLRGGLWAQQGLYGRALPAYESAVRQQPGHPMWWLGLAVALESEGHGARARGAYAQARQLGLPSEDLATYAEQRLRALD